VAGRIVEGGIRPPDEDGDVRGRPSGAARDRTTREELADPASGALTWGREALVD
jgi:hypothetical protein